MPAPTVPKPRDLGGDSGSESTLHRGTHSAAPVSLLSVHEEAEARIAAFSALVARKREAQKKGQEEKQVKQAEKQGSVETWSGLRVTERCVRQSKWDAAMNGKELVSFSQLSMLRSRGKDQVVIGVLCEPVATRSGETCADLVLTDLHLRSPQTATVVLKGCASEHRGQTESRSRRQFTVGSIFAVLNPTSLKQPMTIAVSHEEQVLKLGVCPSLRFCQVTGRGGCPCRRPYSAEGCDAFCGLHASSVHHEQAGGQQHCVGGGGGDGGGGGCRRKRKRLLAVAAVASSSELCERKKFCQERRLTGGRPDKTMRGMALAEQAALKLATAARAGSSMKLLLQTLEDMETFECAPGQLECSPLYEQVVALMHRSDDVGAAAKRLLRAWRLLVTDAASARGGA